MDHYRPPQFTIELRSLTLSGNWRHVP